MILKNKTDFVQWVAGNKVNPYRTTVVPEGTIFDKRFWEIEGEKVKIEDNTKNKPKEVKNYGTEKRDNIQSKTG
jgi:hypothetical protein